MGFITKTILIIFLIILVVVAAAGFYFYKYHTFKTLKACVSDDVTVTTIACVSNEECFSTLVENPEEVRASFAPLPDGAERKMLEVIDTVFFCEGVCKQRTLYGTGFADDESIEPCRDGDTEITYNIKGDEAIEFLRLAKNNIFNKGE